MGIVRVKYDCHMTVESQDEQGNYLHGNIAGKLDDQTCITKEDKPEHSDSS